MSQIVHPLAPHSGCPLLSIIDLFSAYSLAKLRFFNHPNLSTYGPLSKLILVFSADSPY